MFPGSRLVGADVLVELERAITPLVDPRAGPGTPAGGDRGKGLELTDEVEPHEPGLLSAPVRRSHEQAFGPDGEDLDVEGF